MELLFIWIKNYKSLARIGLNFSNEFFFQYSEETNSLQIERNLNFIPNFFGENINNFTGLIGENGAGKTTILRYILQYLVPGINDEDENAVIVFKSQGLFYCYSTNETNFISQSIDTRLFQWTDDLHDLKASLTCVFVSNHFDPSSFYSHEYTNLEFAGMKNLSSYFLLYSDIQARFNIDMEKGDISFNSRMEAFAAGELKRIVRVIRWINRKNAKNPFPVSSPPFLNLKLMNFYDESISQRKEALDKEIETYFSYLTSKDDRFLVNSFISGITHIINQGTTVVGDKRVEGYYFELSDRVIHSIRDKRIQKSPDDSFITRVERLFGDIMVTGNSVLHNQLKSLQFFLKFLDEFVRLKSAKISQDGTVLSFKMTSNLSRVEELIDEFYRAEKIGDYAEFYFSHAPFSESSLSSGEYVLLSLIGRLNSLNTPNNSSLLLLIDEAELGLHPQWRKQFVSLLTEFISERFRQNKIQIILTSHSPFILSDLPSHCCIFLKRKDNIIISPNTLEKIHETFGSNIHELFTDSFFLQNGLMGEFSRQKIDDLVKEIFKKDKFDSEYYNKVKPLINIIGEPFVRQKLLEKIASGMSPQDVDYLILDRERELSNLKAIRNDKNRTS